MAGAERRKKENPRKFSPGDFSQKHFPLPEDKLRKTGG